MNGIKPFEFGRRISFSRSEVGSFLTGHVRNAAQPKWYTSLFGVFLLFLSFYCFIAFTSYFFTWKNDHDVVYRFSWDIFPSDVQVDNWLGRLDAFLADSVIYWGFGASSYCFVYLFYIYGLAFIHHTTKGHLNIAFLRTIILMVLCSVVCSFSLQRLEFPWGGVLGQYIQNYIGIGGTLALMLFALVATSGGRTTLI